MSVRFGRGDDPPPPRAAEKEKFLYVGARFCKRCHEQPRTDDNTDYVLLTEYEKWKKEDKHAQVYQVLTEDRSQQMGKILDWPNVKKDPRCLNCHAANNIPVERLSNDFDICDGVSCDICHGPASQWIVPHADKKNGALKSPSWRQKRGYTGRPGRPPMHAWPMVLVEDALHYAKDPDLAKQYDEYVERLQKLRQAFDARPFGDPKEIAECARHLRDWSEGLLQRLKEVRYNSSSARRLLRGLCGAKEVEKYDYDSARQKPGPSM
ncbi:MAG TPA: multiheme c-type cytochrome [Gemmataceae bacterium]